MRNKNNVERILKESAIDCQLEYKRNYVDSKNNSKECDYSENVNINAKE